MNLFAEKRIEDLFNQTDLKLQEYINSLSEESILSYETTSLVDDIFTRYQIRTDIKISDENVTTDIKLENPNDIYGRIIPGRSKEVVVYYTFQINGDYQFLMYQPQTHSSWTFKTTVNPASLIIPIRTGYFNSDLPSDRIQDVKTKIDEYLCKINHILLQIKTECSNYNLAMRNKISVLLENRKDNLLRLKKMQRDLNPYN